jgi:CBS domain-containing protein
MMTLEKNLQQEKVSHLDLSNFTKVESGTSVRETITVMRQEAHHCAIVMDGGALIGIFTDRDILRKVVDASETWDQPIDQVMTPTPITVNSSDPADAALALMDAKHFRNVPVTNKKGQVIGNLTHYAIIKYLADHFPKSVYNLPPNPDQVTSRRGGA